MGYASKYCPKINYFSKYYELVGKEVYIVGFMNKVKNVVLRQIYTDRFEYTTIDRDGKIYSTGFYDSIGKTKKEAIINHIKKCEKNLKLNKGNQAAENSIQVNIDDLKKMLKEEM